MEIVTNWRAKRAGASITITHATGKITGVMRIEPRYVKRSDGPGLQDIVAVRGDGKEFRLVVS